MKKYLILISLVILGLLTLTAYNNSEQSSDAGDKVATNPETNNQAPKVETNNQVKEKSGTADSVIDRYASFEATLVTHQVN